MTATEATKPTLDEYWAHAAQNAGLSGLDGVQVTWRFRAVHADLRSKNDYRYPWPGHWAEAPGPILDHTDACPRAAGDGLCVAKTFYGAGLGGIAPNTLLLVGVADEDVLGEDDHKLRVRRMYVADVLALAPVLAGADLTGAYLTGADFTHADLAGADLTRADLTGADLTGAYLTGAHLTHAHLTGADLAGAVLARADLTGAYLTGAYLTRADLTRADLTGAHLTGADLTRADLTGAVLAGADLTGAYLTGAVLAGAVLAGAYLTGAVLAGAVLAGAYLTRADLAGADLTGARYDQLTVWPEGFDPTAAGAVKVDR